MPRLYQQGTYLTPSLTLCMSSLAITKTPSSTNTVNLRIEGDNVTYFEGPITSGPRNISLPQSPNGGPDFTYPCNDLNDDANPTPGNTPLDALDAAAKDSGFTYDGFFQGEFNDFDITRISTSIDQVEPNPDGSLKYWGQLVNYQISTHRSESQALTLTSCQQEVKAGDEVLWAFITDPPGDPSTGIGTGTDVVFFLKLAPTAVTVKKGKGFIVTVTDGRTGIAVQNASVDGVHTDVSGKATLYLFDTGFFQFKAHRTGDVRSNVMNVTVTN